MKRILAVDDEARVLALIQKRLEFAGYEVITAVNGTEALHKARSERPNLIVLDLMLPGLNGYQVCRLLKNDETCRDIPILMLSSRSQETDITEGMRMGADDYMTKPYDSDKFIARVQSLLASYETRQASIPPPNPEPGK